MEELQALMIIIEWEYLYVDNIQYCTQMSGTSENIPQQINQNRNIILENIEESVAKWRERGRAHFLLSDIFE